MKEDYGDIWDFQLRYDAIAITTNGFVKKNGEAVMGRGVALEAAKKYPEFPKHLGQILKEFGNNVWPFSFDQWNGEEAYEDIIFSFPVKPEYGPRGEPGWRSKADIGLIKRSAEQLVQYMDEIHFARIVIPRPGCGNGGLKWEDVKPVIQPILDDRFTVVTWHP